MPKGVREKIEADQAAKANRQQELFNNQEAEREANGDFSQAPGLTPEQREAAEMRWAQKNPAESGLKSPLSCLHKERPSDWSEVRLANSGGKLRYSSPPRSNSTLLFFSASLIRRRAS
jgi:hypothetical protein